VSLRSELICVGVPISHRTTRQSGKTRSMSAERRHQLEFRLCELVSVLHPDGEGNVGEQSLGKLKYDMALFLDQNPIPGCKIDDNLVVAVSCLVDNIPVIVVGGGELEKELFVATLMKFAMEYIHLHGPNLVITTNDKSVKKCAGLLQQPNKEITISKETNSVSLGLLSANAGFLVLSKKFD
jgi:hypothetical protein